MRGTKGLISIAVIILTVAVLLVFIKPIAALPLNSCTDVDGTNTNIKGYVSGYEDGYPYTYYDICSGGYVIEYVCAGSYWSDMYLACPSGSCSNGACVPVCTPQCPTASTVACGTAITPTNGCGSCTGTGTYCASGTCTNGQCIVSDCQTTGCDRGYICDRWGGTGSYYCSCPNGYVEVTHWDYDLNRTVVDRTYTGYQTCTSSCGEGCYTPLQCVNTLTDTNNCGGCSNACPSGISCVNSKCQCPSGTTFCNGKCVDTSSDVNNCGGCGSTAANGVTANICPPVVYESETGGTTTLDKKYCSAGTCVQCTKDIQCGIGICLNGFCTETCNSVAGNYGGFCGSVQGPYLNAQSSEKYDCGSGTCWICSSNYKDCNSNTADGCEANIQTSNSNCGACGNVCGAGANTGKPNCVNGQCTAESDILCSSLSQSACNNYPCCYNDYTNPTGKNPTWLGCKPSPSTTVCSSSKAGNAFSCSATITYRYCDGSHAVCGSSSTTSTEYATTGKLWYYSGWQTATTSLYCASDSSPIACSGNQPQKGVYGCINLYGTAYCYNSSNYYNNRVGYINSGPPCSGSTPYCLDGKCVQCKQDTDCPAGQTCVSGECKPITCFDSDGDNNKTAGYVEIFVGGVSQGKTPDACIDNTHVTEYVCNGNAKSSKTETCAPGYECDYLYGACNKSQYSNCSDIPVTRSPPWQTSPLDYSYCCLNEPAVPGADYAAWQVIGPAVTTPGYTIAICKKSGVSNGIPVSCGTSGSSTKGTDGLCPESIVSGFSCSVCDADCFGADQCNGQTKDDNGQTKDGAACNSYCQPIGPLVKISGLPSSCVNQDQTATATCTQRPGGFACQSDSEKLKFYSSNPGICSRNYNIYDLPKTYTATTHGWLCAAAKNIAGVTAASAPVEVRIDKESSVISSASCSSTTPTTTSPVFITVTASDSWCGISSIVLKDNGVQIANSPSSPLTYSSTFTYRTHAITATATDSAGNSVPTPAVVCTIIPNDPPTAAISKLSGNCRAGQSITIGCAASDSNQPASTLAAKAWLGTCSDIGCSSSNANWVYLNSASMVWNGQTFVSTYTIPSNVQKGTNIAAQCQATDEKNAASGFGNAYPLCTIDCETSSFSNIVANPDPAWSEDVTITFTSSADLVANPVVNIYPKTGAPPNRQAAYKTNNGNNYVYTYTTLSTDPEGIYNIQVAGSTGPGCPVSAVGTMNVKKPLVLTAVPSISSPADISYEVGATGNSISWTPNSNGGVADKYTIKRGSATVVSSAPWSSGTAISYSVDGLSVGSYTYMIEVFNTNGNSATNFVSVNVNPKPTAVSITGLPAACTNQDQAASVSCTGSCDVNSYKMKFYAANPGSCSTTYSDYTLSNPYTATAYGWLCAAAKNIAGTMIFSVPYEVKIDKAAPVISGTCSSLVPKTDETVDISASASDSGCSGLKEIKLFDSTQIASSALSPLLYSSTFAYGTHAITSTATDNAGNSATGSTCTIISNDKPAVNPVQTSSACVQGQTIVLNCKATDNNQPASTLAAKAWLGTCSKGSGSTCFDTRNWIYLNGASMTWNAATQNFMASFTLPDNTPDGTAIASTCSATDEKGAESWGDSYPLCTVLCTNPTFSNIAASPNPAWSEGVTITFTGSADLIANPTVTVSLGQATGRQAVYVSNNGNNYVYRYTVRPSDSEGGYDVKITGNKSSSCQGTSSGSLAVNKTSGFPTTDILCDGKPCPAKPDDNTTITLTCSPPGKCDKTYVDTGSGFSQYNSPFQIKKCGTATIRYYSESKTGLREPVKTTTFNVGCNSVYMVPSLSMTNIAVEKGQVTTAVFSCIIKYGSSVVDTCTSTNTKISGINIDVDDVNKKTKHNYMTENGVNTGDEQFKENYTATMYGSIQVPYNNVWAFDIDTQRYHSTINVTAIYIPAGLTNSTSITYNVLNAEPAATLMNASIKFTDVENGIVPLTSGGYPNFTLSLPINFVGTGKIYSNKQWVDCTAQSCFAEYRLFDGSGTLLTYSGMEYSTADSAFIASYNSAGLSCNSVYNMSVLIGTRDGSAGNISSSLFFVNCEPRLIVTPVEARSALGDKNRPVFTVTMVNPKSTGMNYNFEISAVNTDQSFAVGFLKPTKTQLYVEPVSSGTIDIYLSDIGAGRSGSFKMKFTATNSFGKEYSSVNYLLIFAEGLDEFAAWQLVFLVVAGVLVFYGLEKTGMNRIRVRNKT